jgi:hypothetical protein
VLRPESEGATRSNLLDVRSPAYAARVRKAAALAILVACWSAPAAAQPWTGERIVRERSNRVEGDVAFFGNDPTYVISPSFRARLRAVDDHWIDPEAFIVDIDLAWRSVGALGTPDPNDDSYRVGNPYIGVRLGYRKDIWIARGGLGSTVPVTNAFEDGPEDNAAYAYGQAMHGMWDPWLLEPQIQPVIARGDFEIHGDYGYGGLDAAFAVAFPLRRDGTGNTEVVFETGAFGGWTPFPELAIGARAQFVYASDWPVGFSGVDEAQFSVIPFIRIDPDSCFFDFRLVLNLDYPWGFSFIDNPGVWAVEVNAGARF